MALLQTITADLVGDKIFGGATKRMLELAKTFKSDSLEQRMSVSELFVPVKAPA